MTDERVYYSDRQDRYEVKVFDYNENGPGRYPILVIRVETEGHGVLGGCGYGDGATYLFARLRGSAQALTADAREFTRRFCAHDDNLLRQLLVSLQRGTVPFDVLTDDGVMTPRRIESVLDTYGVGW